MFIFKSNVIIFNTLKFNNFIHNRNAIYKLITNYKLLFEIKMVKFE